MPWIAIPFQGDISLIEDKVVPCTGYPTPGIVNGRTGEVIKEDAFGEITVEYLMKYL